MTTNHNNKMRTTYKRILKTISFMALLAVVTLAGACSKSRSYSELLREEERAVNKYLATQKIINEVPADSVSFEVGEDAPFYKLDQDGYLYMQVINKGEVDASGKPVRPVKEGDIVYFRFKRLNLKSIYLGYTTDWEGPMNDLSASASTSLNFIYKNTYIQSTSYYGLGIQWPLKFLGYNSEVNLVLQSYYGFQDDQTACNPYLINIKYYAPEY